MKKIFKVFLMGLVMFAFCYMFCNAVVRGYTVIRSGGALTTSYVPGTTIECGYADKVAIFLRYLQGTGETSNGVNMKLMWSNNNSNFYGDCLVANTALGSRLATMDAINELVYVSSTVNPSPELTAYSVDVIGKYMQISFKETGVATYAGCATVEAVLIEKQ